jgi:hypothetical protein
MEEEAQLYNNGYSQSKATTKQSQVTRFAIRHAGQSDEDKQDQAQENTDEEMMCIKTLEDAEAG